MVKSSQWPINKLTVCKNTTWSARILYLYISLENSKMFLEVQETCDRKLTSIRDELATDLFELEDEYYSSTIKSM